MFIKGHVHSEEVRKRISKSLKGKIPWNKGLSNWDGCFQKGYTPWNKGKNIGPHSREWRDKISKSNTGELSSQWIDGRTNTPEYKRYVSRARKALVRKGGKLSVKTIQLIYEDNIKQYGTLTCYLCFNPIVFGDDHLEHKTPLIRGGNNDYKNLAISCSGCNHKKHSKTEKEFRDYQSS